MTRIALLATGGTIACRQMEHGLTPALTGAELIRGIPMSRDAELVSRDVFSMDSSNIQPEEWAQLARAIDQSFQDCDGVVVTHGTDTMGYTAAALSFMLLGQKKPVILTGSQLPLGAPLSDAESNLSCAIEAAMQGVPGTYVCFNRKLILGTRAVKTRTTSFDAFDSVNRSLSGMIDSEGVHFLRPQKIGRPYQLRASMDSRVFLLKLIPGTQPSVLDYVLTNGYRGLVIEAFGLGGLHYIRRNLVEKLKELRRHGILILVVTQCMYEKADLSIYEVGNQLLSADVISGQDMTTEAAVTKLMWALTQPRPAELLSENLCGEVRE